MGSASFLRLGLEPRLSCSGLLLRGLFLSFRGLGVLVIVLIYFPQTIYSFIIYLGDLGLGVLGVLGVLLGGVRLLTLGDRDLTGLFLVLLTSLCLALSG